MTPPPRTPAQEARNRSRQHLGERRMEDALPGDLSIAESNPLIRPYGDTTGDGMVQTSFTLPLPHATRDDLTLTRAGHDLALRVGGVQRNIPLPASLLDADVFSARMDAGVLTITFTHEEES